ncbi:50S ribosomal protein L18 [Alkalibacter saccharofermentans]|jgi:large subunit ribosomal protein L18|uniref:Large ribosomal subunit protein uL18 n=1 Tax=Alkalibacter saccharofermentans DSM 14828 TaxID=1120975 RepID=A0A1M4Y8J7_9FIRM|nr:50S ribosomal protein L18 [Alkalibacter saccharofermentans]SHF02038.1 LSU ribosomal protein L18P [Alkalibacter saccharofermentans DSM 14828]
MIKKPVKNKIRKNRHKRMRFKINGTSERPRLNVYRSNSNIYAQIIDDSNGTTLVSASTLDKDLKEKLSSTRTKEAAKMVGKAIGEKAISKGIDTVVFDRGGYIYHGKIKELAEGAREAGLKF